MSDVFISYSRKNQDFAQRLIERLNLANKDSWVDWEGIPLTAPNWWSEIKSGIENSDSFLFIMSPDSMASVVCNLELDYALNLGKRIIPIVHQEVNSRDTFASFVDYNPDTAMEQRLAGKQAIALAAENWQQLSHINWIFFREDDDFDTAFEKLVETVETDLDYVKAHTRYLTRAQEWQRNDRRSDLLLFGEEIDRAETWLSKARRYAEEAAQTPEQRSANPLPQSIQEDYIATSRQAEQHRRRLARSAQVSIVVLAIALIIGAIIGVGIVSQTREQVISAQETLTPIPQTIAFAEAQVTLAVEEQNTAIANERTALANVTEGAMINETAVEERDQAATSEAQALQNVADAEATLTPIQATVTQSALISDIAFTFGRVLLDGVDTRDLVELNQLIETYPEEARVYISRGLVYHTLLNYEAAIADFNSAIELDPGNASAYVNRGNVYHDLENYEAAIADFDRGIALDPMMATAYSNRGVAYSEIGEMDAAIADYTSAIELDPNNVSAYSNRGIAYDKLGDYQAAIDDFSIALELDPQFIEVYTDRGVAYSNLGEMELAIADYNRALELDPNNVNVLNNRGIAYSDLGEHKTAIENFSAAIEIEPTDATLHFYRGLSYSDLADYEQAIANYDVALELDPTDSEYYTQRGIAYAFLDDYKPALADFDMAIELDPENPQYYFNRGFAHVLAENYIEGLADWNQADAMGYEFPEEIQEIYDSLSELLGDD